MKRDEKIPLNLETTALQIKTDSAAGSGDEALVFFFTAGGDVAGNVILKFNSPPQYHIGWCTRTLTDLPSTLPREVNKVWEITKLPGPRITVLCNGVTVVDLVISNTTCYFKHWNTYWTKQVTQIQFDSHDKASNEYRAALPGNPSSPYLISRAYLHMLFHS